EHKTLKEIGALCDGVTRQRVAQLLQRHYGTTRPALVDGTLTEDELAQMLVINRGVLKAWRLRGKVQGIHVGRYVYYVPEEVERARKLADKR
ncbi:unnamed protein product, partial [marine sediment metagenome]